MTEFYEGDTKIKFMSALMKILNPLIFAKIPQIFSKFFTKILKVSKMIPLWYQLINENHTFLQPRGVAPMSLPRIIGQSPLRQTVQSRPVCLYVRLGVTGRRSPLMFYILSSSKSR